MNAASFWRRLGAYLIDGLILYGVWYVAGTVLAQSLAYLEPTWAASVTNVQWELCLNLLQLVIMFLYFVLCESSPYQATPGKRVLKLQVGNLSGGRISIRRASIRFFSRILSNLTLGVGYLMVLLPKRRSLHDFIAGTTVFRC